MKNIYLFTNNKLLKTESGVIKIVDSSKYLEGDTLLTLGFNEVQAVLDCLNLRVPVFSVDDSEIVLQVDRVHIKKSDTHLLATELKRALELALEDPMVKYNYRECDLPAQKAVGCISRIAANSPIRDEITEDLWSQFNSTSCLPKYATDDTVEVCCHYGEDGSFDLLTGQMVTNFSMTHLHSIDIPAGRYAAFTFKRDDYETAEREINELELKRRFTADYFIYKKDSVQLFISIF